MSSQLIQRLEIKKINDNISIIDYAGFEVLAMTSSPYRNYINATKLCKQDKKEFKHWLENQTSKELMIIKG